MGRRSLKYRDLKWSSLDGESFYHEYFKVVPTNGHLYTVYENVSGGVTRGPMTLLDAMDYVADRMEAPGKEDLLRKKHEDRLTSAARGTIDEYQEALMDAVKDGYDDLALVNDVAWAKKVLAAQRK